MKTKSKALRIIGTKDRPRLSVFRSNKFIYAQLIDDSSRKTLIGVSEKEIKAGEKATKTQKAKNLGISLAQKSKEKKIKRVIFQRGEYPYKGRIKSFIEGVREGGLEL